MKFFLSACIFFGLFFSAEAFSADDKFTPLDVPSVLEKAKTQSNVGVLKVDNDGYAYLSVSETEVKELLPLLYQAIPSKYRVYLLPDNNRDGPHISLPYDRGYEREESMKLYPYLGEKIKFFPTGVAKFSKNKIYHHHCYQETFYILVVKSPELEALIKKEHVIFHESLHISLTRSRELLDSLSSCR